MSRFKYDVTSLGQEYLSIHIYKDEERQLVEKEIANGNFERLSILTGDMDNLDFISECLPGGPKRLLIQGGVKSLSGLDRFINLVELNCDDQTMGKPYPDFGKLANLEKCFLAWDKKYDAKGYLHGLFTLRKLKDLTLRYWAKPDCKEIAQLKQLERLDLRQGALACLGGLENCSGLKELHISYLPKLTDISRLNDLQSIEKIHIQNCPNITDYESLTRLRNMRHIHLEKVAAEFPDLNWLTKMHQLEKICLSCEISRIDWLIFFNHTTLKSVAVRSHEGYNVPDTEILKIAESVNRKIKNFKRLGTKNMPSFVFDLE